MTDVKEEKFQNKYSDLVSWVSDDLAHRLAKKLTQSEVDSLLAEFRRAVIESRQKEANSK